MRRALVVALALAGAAGCNKKPAETPAEAAIRRLGELRDRACACTDKACVDLAKKELADWLLADGAKLGTIKFTLAQDAAGKKASDEMDRCVEKTNQSLAN